MGKKKSPKTGQNSTPCARVCVCGKRENPPKRLAIFPFSDRSALIPVAGVPVDRAVRIVLVRFGSVRFADLSRALAEESNQDDDFPERQSMKNETASTPFGRLDLMSIYGDERLVDRGLGRGK